MSNSATSFSQLCSLGKELQSFQYAKGHTESQSVEDVQASYYFTWVYLNLFKILARLGKCLLWHLQESDTEFRVRERMYSVIRSAIV
jgi:hypothetical protein